MTWEVRPSGSVWAVGLTDEEGQVIRLHPIPFYSEREAHRGADRLNAAYAKVPRAHLDEH